MVNYELKYTADLENVAQIKPGYGLLRNLRFSYYFKLKCECCGEVTKKETCVSLDEKFPILSNRNTYTNLIQQCKFCEREGTVTLYPYNWAPGYDHPLTAAMSAAGKYAPLMRFDIKGFEPFDFCFLGEQWSVTANSGTVYEGVDISDWADYDEDGDCEISVTNPKGKFEVIRGYMWKNYFLSRVESCQTLCSGSAIVMIPVMNQVNRSSTVHYIT